MRVLVTIANHGTKNRAFLDTVLAAYRDMPFDVRLVVLSDQPKDLGPDVEVRVGAPTDDPRSLPFAHQRVMADAIDDHDLFVYSEDDTLVTEANLRAFLAATERLPVDLVPGFLRFEERPTGERSYCSFHTSFRWDPSSVRTINGIDVARFTNAHSAMYVLTRDQLRRAIDSGNYLVPPHAGVYSQMVSAATDVYTSCGLRRVICLSAIDDFMIHHLPNIYLDRLGIDPHDFELQRQALADVRDGRLGRSALLDGSSDLPVRGLQRQVWGRRPFAALRDAVAGVTGPVLSIGATTGDLERDLFPFAHEVVAVPVDEVLGTLCRDRGLRTARPDLDTALHELQDERFELVLLADILKHVANPPALLGLLRHLLRPDGRIVATVPNLRRERLANALRRPGRAEIPRVGAFGTLGVHHTDGSVLRSWMRTAGCDMVSERYGSPVDPDVDSRAPRALQRWVGRTAVVVGVPPLTTRVPEPLLEVASWS